MARLSVITPTFNLIKAGREAVFRQAIDSLHQQSLQGIEHILVDGASTDGTLELIDELVGKRSDSTVISEPDQGLYDAMNKGVSRGTGKYVIFLNSDDYYHDCNGLRTVYRTLERTGADYSYAPVRIIKPDGLLNVWNPLSPGRALSRMPFAHMAMMLRRTLFLDLGGFDTRYVISADHDFILRSVIFGARGESIGLNFATFRLGGLSSDAVTCDVERLAIWKKNFPTLASVTNAEIAASFARGMVPRKVSRAILRSPDAPADLRHAARREYWRSVRNSIIRVHTGSDARLDLFGHRII